MADTINFVANALVGFLMKPFAHVSPWPGLVASSAFLAVLALLVFKYGSDQWALRRAKGVMLARVLEIDLFKDDLAGIFRAFGRLLIGIGNYMRSSLKPFLILILPVLVLLFHLAGWFEYRPLRSGEASVLTIRLDAGLEDSAPIASVAASDGIEIETEAFMSPGGDEIMWRFRAVGEDGEEWIEATVGDVAYRKQVMISPRVQRISCKRVKGGFWQVLAHPAEPRLPEDGRVALMEIQYPERALRLGAVRVNWILALFVLSLAFGVLLKYPLRVDF